MNPRSHGFAVIPARALDDTRVTHAMVLMLATLGTYADRTGKCWPAQATLAQRRGVTQQAVSKLLVMLEHFGYLRITRGYKQVSCYEILMNGELPAEFDRWRDEWDQGPSPLDEADQRGEVVPDALPQLQVVPEPAARRRPVDKSLAQPGVVREVVPEMASMPPDAAPGTTSGCAEVKALESKTYPPLPPVNGRPRPVAEAVVGGFLAGEAHKPVESIRQVEAAVEAVLRAGWEPSQVAAALPECLALTKRGLEVNLRRLFGAPGRAAPVGARIPAPESHPHYGCPACDGHGWIEGGGGMVRCQAATGAAS